MTFILLYDIGERIDPHGLRIRILRELRKIGAINIQKSTWITPKISEKLKILITEAENINANIIISKYEPIKFNKNKIIGLVKPSSFDDSNYLVKINKIFSARKMVLMEKNCGKSCQYRLPSDAVNVLCGRSVDYILFITKVKNLENAMYVGYEVLENSIYNSSTKFIEIAKIEELQKYVLISWTPESQIILDILSSELNLEIINGCSPPQERFTIKGEFFYRKIFGISIGDKICINNVPIARAEQENVSLISQKGRIIDIIGSTIDRTKLKTIGRIQLDRAIVMSMKDN